MAIVWQWPQITLAAIFGISVALSALLHGKPKSAGTYHFATTTLCIIIECALLYFGGFWTEVRP